MSIIWRILDLVMNSFWWLLDLAYAHPYIAGFLIAWILVSVVMVIADGGSSGGSYSGGGSISSYTSSISQAGSDAKSQMRNASDAYIRNVRNTIGRD